MKEFLKTLGAGAADQVKRRTEDGKDWVKGKLDDSAAAQKLKQALVEQLEGAMESTVARKTTEYEQGKGEKRAVRDVITACAYRNAAISGAISLVPGPWGMIGVAPEIAMVMKNQMEMVYDIGVAHGHEPKQLNKEIVAAVLVSALSSGVAGLVVMHGGKVLVKRASLRIFQRIVAILAGKVTQQALKSALSKWVPVAGAAFMAWLSKTMTERVGAKADEFFRQPIVIVDDEVAEEDVTAAEEDLEAKPRPAA